MAHHKVKSWVGLYEHIESGNKTHDLRGMDRSWSIGDIVTLQEFDQFKGKYTGNECQVVITYITSNNTPCAFSSSVLDNDYCILSVKKV